MDRSTEERGALPETWRADLAARLGPGEVMLGWFETDLDAALRFADGLVVLTNRRVLAAEAGPPGGRPWQSWDLAEVAALKARDRAGVGTLELLGPAGRLAAWSFTAAHAPAARRLADRLEALRAGEDLGAEPEGAELRACPDCGAVLEPEQETCPACDPKTTRKRVAALVRLVRFSRDRAGAISLGFVLTLAAAVVGLVPYYLTKPLLDDVLIPFDRGSKPVDFRLAAWYLAGLGGAALLTWLLSWARTYVIAWVGERVSADLRNRTYAHLQALSLEFFGGKRTGDLISRIGSDTDRICNFLSINLVEFASDILMIVGTFVILWLIDPILTLASFAPFPIIAWMVLRVRGKMRRRFHRSSRAWGEMTSVLADTIPGIRVVKAFAQERREIERFRQANDHVLKVNDQVNAVWARFGPELALMTQVGLLIVWSVGAWRIYGHRSTVGTLTMFLGYITRFYTLLESMGRLITATQRAAASAQRIFEILDRTPSVPEPVRPVPCDQLRGGIELRHVSFRYGSRQVLHDLDLEVRPGEMIGLVGASGAGKSTLVNLVCRFYDVAEGEIRVDGVNIKRFPVEEYRRHIGLVLQEPFLFFGTIAENIAYGRPDASREEIIAAARAAHAHAFILRQPDGYDTMVGERGQGLSGGERQRISIARALLIDPAILILDEATSSVDTETEREIQAALDNLTRGRTTIAIAHRLSTLRKADRLVVLERGRVVEIGHHRELMDRSGAYARLHRAQAELAGTP